MPTSNHSVNYTNPGIIGWLYLFRDWQKAAFLIIIVIIVGIATSNLSSDSFIYPVSAAMGGIWMLRFTDSAEVIINRKDTGLIIERLTASKFEINGGKWNPPLPKYLRWRNTSVNIKESCDSSNNTKITGPYSYLIRLTRGL